MEPTGTSMFETLSPSNFTTCSES